MKILAKWALHALALLVVAYLYSGVEIHGFAAALIAALIIGLLNAVVRPLLVILTLPVTIVTMGLFLFVINALLFWGAAEVLDSFYVQGFVAALIGSLLYSTLSLAIGLLLDRLFPKQ